MTIARLRGGSNGRSAVRLRFVEQIARCGELGSEGRGGLVAQGQMGPCRVLVGHPAGDDLSGSIEAEEQRFVREFVPHLELKASQMPVSSSSAFRRLASDTSTPPNLAFEAENVALLIPCRRQSSTGFLLPQNADDLFLGKLRSLDGPVL